MRRLFDIDTKDYDSNGKKFVRDSARSILISGERIAMVHSLKYDYYKFPGGGIRAGEDPVDAMIRETEEEAGLIVIPESVREYGLVHRVQKSDHVDAECFVQDNYYYLCSARPNRISQKLDDYEAEERFTLEYIKPEDAIRTNREKDHGPKDQRMLEREARVLEMLLDEGFFAAGTEQTILHTFTAYEQLDPRRLMGLYAEGNLENADFFYPDMPDRQTALQKVEDDFLDFIRTEFLAKEGNAYQVLEADGVWVSAVRLYRLKPGFFYLEALETHPDHRRRGYAIRLLTALIEKLKKEGPFTLCDCVSKKNEASIRTHFKCGFRIASEEGMDYLRGETNPKNYGMRLEYGIG